MPNTVWPLEVNDKNITQHGKNLCTSEPRRKYAYSKYVNNSMAKCNWINPIDMTSMIHALTIAAS
jgi:hypothetical protein